MQKYPITILVIDAIGQRRANQQLKAQLIREIRSPENGIALRALQEVHARGWAVDGSLRKAYLLGANLEKAYLRDVDLSSAWMRDVNLRGAYMKDAKLNGSFYRYGAKSNVKGMGIADTSCEQLHMLRNSLTVAGSYVKKITPLTNAIIVR